MYRAPIRKCSLCSSLIRGGLESRNDSQYNSRACSINTFLNEPYRSRFHSWRMVRDYMPRDGHQLDTISWYVLNHDDI